jgi:hypothetical protein
MKMVVEVNTFDNLLDNSWGQAIDTLKMIDRYGLQEEFMEHMEELFGDYCEEPYTDTQINDYIAYEFDVYEWIAEHKNIDDIEDMDELEELATDLYFTEAKATITDFKCADKEELSWQYIQNNYAGYSLLEVMQELENISVSDLEEE